MLQFCMFGGYEGPLSAEKKCCFTIFGGCELNRPTLARQMLTALRVREGKVPAPKLIFVTIFGSTEIKCPTLAEEYLDMRESLASGAIRAQDWDRNMAELDRYQSSALLSLTLFGAFSESELPTEDQ